MPPFAQIADVHEGTKLIADGGFTCLKAGAAVTVERGADGLFVPCADGKHFIDGQLDDGDEYIGLYLG